MQQAQPQWVHLGAGEIAIILFCLAIGVVSFGFWIWMLVDCARNEVSGGPQVAWLLIIIFTGVIGALIYLFARKISRAPSASAPPLRSS